MSSVDFEELFARVTPLAGRRPEEFSITPLPGYTNRNFRLHNGNEDWVLRVPRSATNRFIDRNVETANQSRATELGIAPRVCWCDDSGLSLTPTLPGRTLTAVDLGDVSILRAVATTLGLLHRDCQGFDSLLQLDEVLERYYAMLPTGLRQKYWPRLDAARSMLPRLQDRDLDYVPSHNDPVLENLLLAPDRIWLIDWEYSAMASPYWDLATVCNAAHLDHRQSRELLRLYSEDGPAMEEMLLFDYRNLLQLLSDCWMAALVD
jgi:thiamine kinase-like enzyme